MTTASTVPLGLKSYGGRVTSLAKKSLTWLCRYLNCNGIHDQGHKFRNDIVDVQFVERKANTSDSHAFSLRFIAN